MRTFERNIPVISIKQQTHILGHQIAVSRNRQFTIGDLHINQDNAAIGLRNVNITAHGHIGGLNA